MVPHTAAAAYKHSRNDSFSEVTYRQARWGCKPEWWWRWGGKQTGEFMRKITEEGRGRRRKRSKMRAKVIDWKRDDWGEGGVEG